MFFAKSKIVRFICCFGLIFSLSAMAFADTIRLKDGSVIKGKIVSFGGGRFTVVIGDGTRSRQLNFTADEIESISFDSAATTESTAPDSTSGDAGQTSPTTIPQTTSPVVSAPNTSANNSANNSANTSAPVNSSVNSNVQKPKPIEINVKVLADNTSNGWTNSGWVVQKGQRIKISSSGRVSLGGGRYATPIGVSALPDTQKLMPGQPTGALIAVIGDDNNEFIFVGELREFVATRDGALFLGINEGNLNDNSGTFDVKLEIDPTQ